MELVEQWIQVPRHEPSTESADAASGGKRSGENISTGERAISGLAGGALIITGLLRPSIRGAAMVLAGGAIAYRAIRGYCPAYNALGIDMAHSNGTDDLAEGAGIEVVKCVTINRSQKDLYNFWRRFEMLPEFMPHLESVDVVDEYHSHWKVKGPLGMTVEWDAEIFRDTPDELIAWRSLPDSDIDNVGLVRFRPAAIGTEVEVHINYRAPLGKVGATLAGLLGEEPRAQLDADLRRFKQLMETGEITTTEGQTSGRSSVQHGKGRNTDTEKSGSFGWGSRDVVEEASWESFPASDPPSW